MILQDRVSGREQATQQTIAVDTNGIKEAVSAISEGMQQQSQVFGQIAELIAAATQSMGQSSELIAKAAMQMSKPRKVVRDKDGKIAAVE